MARGFEELQNKRIYPDSQAKFPHLKTLETF
jgi:hypothetical protein